MAMVLNSEILAEQKSKALNKIVRRERPKLLNFIRKQLPMVEDAEDVLQDVLTDFAQTFLLPEPIEQSTGWLYRVAKNKIADVFRKQRIPVFSQIQNDDDERWLADLWIDEGGADDQMWNESIAQAIDEALDLLPSAQRKVFVWHEIDGLSFKQIQNKTGTTIPTLISRKRYAIKALKSTLQNVYNDLLDN